MGSKKTKKSAVEEVATKATEVANRANEVAQKFVQRFTEDVPADVGALQIQLRKEREAKEKLDKEFHQVQQQLTEAHKEIETHTAEIEEVAERAVKKLETLTSQYDRQIAQLERDKADLIAKKAALEKENALRATQMKTLETNFQAEQAATATLVAARNDFENKSNLFRAKNEQLQNALDVCEARCARLEKELAKAQAESVFQLASRVKRRVGRVFGVSA